MVVQVQILPALCCLHNFIQFYDTDEIHTFGYANTNISNVDTGDLQYGMISCQESSHASSMQDRVALEICDSYQQYLVTYAYVE